MTRIDNKKKLMVALYAIFLSFILLSLSTLLAEDYIGTKMDDEYNYHLTFPSDGKQSHYFVERVDTDADGNIDLTYLPRTNTLDVNVYNINVLHLDCKSMYEDESMKVFGIDGSSNPNYYKKYFIEKNQLNVKIDSKSTIINLTFKHVPIPVKVLVDGQEWWKTSTNYFYDGDDVVFTQVPNGHTEVKIYFKEDSSQNPPIAAFTVKIVDKNKFEFDASSSNDPDGEIEEYLWDLGDGTFDSGISVTHRYSGRVNFTVILTIRDDDKLKDTEIKTINLDKDTDGDGFMDSYDAFPEDPAEWLDSDGDGIGDNSDAFPIDIAASIDSDGDKYPDKWNEGMSVENSTTGLTLDEYPDDPFEHTKTEAGKKPSGLFSDINFIIMVISLIILIVIIVSIVFRSKRQRLGAKGDKLYNDEEFLEKIKHDIVTGESINYMGLTNNELKNMLDEIYENGEVSEKTYEELEEIISESEKILKYQKGN